MGVKQDALKKAAAAARLAKAAAAKARVTKEEVERTRALVEAEKHAEETAEAAEEAQRAHDMEMSENAKGGWWSRFKKSVGRT